MASGRDEDRLRETQLRNKRTTTRGSVCYSHRSSGREALSAMLDHVGEDTGVIREQETRGSGTALRPPRVSSEKAGQGRDSTFGSAGLNNFLRLWGPRWRAGIKAEEHCLLGWGDQSEDVWLWTGSFAYQRPAPGWALCYP